MSVADDLSKRRAEEQKLKEPTQRVEWDAETGKGFLETGHVGDDFNPQSYEDILRKHNLDPKLWRITGHMGMSLWDVPFRNRKTNELEFHKAGAHKFGIERKIWDIDLPALYAEIAATKPVAHVPATGDSTVVVLWADVQTGKVYHLGGVRELLLRLDEKRAALEAYLYRSQFNRIVVADAGDIIEGFGNFPAQFRTNGLSLMDQLDVATTELWKTIRLCERFAPVDVLSVTSNHCAWRRDGKNLAGKPTDDWGLHISRMLEWHNREIGLRVDFHRPEEWQETLQFDVHGTKIGMAHGHQANNPDQIKNWWAKMTHSGVLDCNILITGHFHFASIRPVGKDPTGRSRWHIQAPTLDNGSAWVRNKYGEDGEPALCVFQVNDDGFDIQSLALL
jgi:hypothetical protein